MPSATKSYFKLDTGDESFAYENRQENKERKSYNYKEHLVQPCLGLCSAERYLHGLDF